MLWVYLGCKGDCEMWALLILQPFRHFTYVTTYSPTLPSLYLRHSSFSNHSVTSPTSQFILQPFFRFSYVRNSSLNSPGEPPMPTYLYNIFAFDVSQSPLHPNFPSLHLRHNSFSNPSVALPSHSSFSNHSVIPLRNSSFSNPSFASPMSQTLHLIHLASRPCPRTFIIYLLSIYHNHLCIPTFLHFTYVTTHSPTLPSLYLVTAHSPTIPLFIYVTVHSPTLLSLLLCHKLFT